MESNLVVCINFEINRQRSRMNNPEGVNKIAEGNREGIDDEECGKVRKQNQQEKKRKQK
jgi:hypothetical protein